MIRRPPRSTRTDTLFPYTTLFRSLAYSSINNIGFALIGLAAASPEGVAAVLFYMTVYVAMTMGSFICVLQMRDLDGRPVETIASLSGLSRTRPGLAAALAVLMFSLAGIPPLFGFWPKFLRSEERVVGKGGVRKCRSRWCAYLYKKK